MPRRARSYERAPLYRIQLVPMSSRLLRLSFFLNGLNLPELSLIVQPKPSSVPPEKIPVADKLGVASPSPVISDEIPEEAIKVLNF